MGTRRRRCGANASAEADTLRADSTRSLTGYKESRAREGRQRLQTAERVGRSDSEHSTTWAEGDQDPCGFTRTVRGGESCHQAPAFGGVQAYDRSVRFPESGGLSGPQPSPKHIRGGPMNPIDRSDSSRTANSPPACPACRSSSVTTTAKNPDASTYWRCERCGEIWNVGRHHDGPRRAPAWR